MSWDPYLDLQSGVLRNRLGITDKAELAQAEAELTGYRLIELQLNRPTRSGRGRPQSDRRRTDTLAGFARWVGLTSV